MIRWWGFRMCAETPSWPTPAHVTLHSGTCLNRACEDCVVAAKFAQSKPSTCASSSYRNWIHPAVLIMCNSLRRRMGAGATGSPVLGRYSRSHVTMHTFDTAIVMSYISNQPGAMCVVRVSDSLKLASVTLLV